MKLVIISGRSGSGKSTALHVLEDAGYYCIDNLPAGLLPALAEQSGEHFAPKQDRIAICVDARNTWEQLANFPNLLDSLPSNIETSIIYLDADDDTLIKRFSETRRRHPLSNPETSLQDALAQETDMLTPIADRAELTIDTRAMLFHELRQHIQTLASARDNQRMSLLIQSFGFKRGVPSNADLVFDVRCLPNPHWNVNLRGLTGLDQGVIDFLQAESVVAEMKNDIIIYLEKWLPVFEENNRPYTTISIGCTGGHHRSVYIAQQLSEHFSAVYPDTQIRHREL
ncbi:MAG: UPF0042 nucleotide-binding protein [Porticoccus sp.]|jgi:UPF0042 nucleotide-binding protein